MAQNLLVETQGIDKAEFKANGQYDTVEWGEMTADELLTFLQRVASLTELDYSGEEDYCAPNVLVENPEIGLTGENLSFTLSDGELLFVDVSNDLQCTVTASEAVALATGEKSGAELVGGKAPEDRSASSAAAGPMGEASAAMPDTAKAKKGRGPMKKIALFIGSAIILLGLLAILGGEPGGGLFFVIIGALPAIYGFKKPSAKPVDQETADSVIRAQKFVRKLDENDDEEEDDDYGDDDGDYSVDD